MGIGFHELSFLSYCKKQKPFNTLGVLGRQENFIKKKNLLDIKQNKDYLNEKYSDKLLITALSLSQLTSFDVSEKDQPTKLLNFNNEILNPEKFDAFFDGGSLQHTFNVPNVLKNISNHVKEGGTIIHVTSANNLCGFGFYQFSPEFFLRYYSTENGFKNTSIFVADYDDEKYWYELKNTSNKRIAINTSSRLICLVKTEKFENKNINEIFQEDYMSNTNLDEKKSNLSAFINIKNKFYIKIYFKLLLFFDLFSKRILLNLNKNLKKKKISELIF